MFENKNNQTKTFSISELKELETKQVLRQVYDALVEKGYMQKDGTTDWNEEVYSVTNKGNAYVVDLWYKKKKENKTLLCRIYKNELYHRLSIY